MLTGRAEEDTLKTSKQAPCALTTNPASSSSEMSSPILVKFALFICLFYENSFRIALTAVDVFLLGTVHVSKESAEEARQVQIAHSAPFIRYVSNNTIAYS